MCLGTPTPCELGISITRLAGGGWRSLSDLPKVLRCVAGTTTQAFLRPVFPPHRKIFWLYHSVICFTCQMSPLTWLQYEHFTLINLRGLSSRLQNSRETAAWAVVTHSLQSLCPGGDIASSFPVTETRACDSASLPTRVWEMHTTKIKPARKVAGRIIICIILRTMPGI